MTHPTAQSASTSVGGAFSLPASRAVPPTPTQDALAALRQQGLTMAEIGARYGMSEHWARKWCRRLGVELTPAMAERLRRRIGAKPRAVAPRKAAAPTPVAGCSAREMAAAAAAAAESAKAAKLAGIALDGFTFTACPTAAAEATTGRIPERDARVLRERYATA